MLQIKKALEQAGKRLPFHKSQSPMRWAILSKLDRAHLTAQIALSNRFNLNVRG
jgi:hypothetical protein